MSTIKINELATSPITLADLFAKADENGLMTKNTIQEFSNFLGTVGTLGFKGVLLSTDPKVTEDGIYIAGDAGTYTANGGLVITVNDKITLISVTGTQTVFEKAEFPLTITFDETPEEDSENPVWSGGLFDALALKLDLDKLATEGTALKDSENIHIGKDVYNGYKGILVNSFSKSNSTSSVTFGNNQNVHIRVDTGVNQHFSSYSASFQNFLVSNTRKYFYKFSVTDTSDSLSAKFRVYYSDTTYDEFLGYRNGNDYFVIFEPTKNLQANFVIRTSGTPTVIRENQLLIDLSEIYGEGNEPSLFQFYDFLKNSESKWFNDIYVNTDIQKLIVNNINKTNKIIDYRLVNRLYKSNADSTSTVIENSIIHIGLDGTNFILSSYTNIAQVLNIEEDKVYFCFFKAKETSTALLGQNLKFIYSNSTEDEVQGNVLKGTIFANIKATETLPANITFQSNSAGNIERLNQSVICLTDLFGEGNEPSAEYFYNYYLSNFNDYFIGQLNSIDFVQKYVLKDILNLKQSIYTPSSVMKSFLKDIDKHFVWYDTIRKILYFVDASIPRTDRIVLYASYDYGFTYKAVYTSTQGDIKVFKTLESGYHLIRTNNSRMSRLSPDFSITQTNFQDTYSQPLTSELGIADDGNGTVMFAEYSATEGAVTNIYKSIDDGLTWSITKDNTGIRHWHSVQVDPYTGYFWACSGDAGGENNLFYTVDQGSNWLLAYNSGDQNSRAVGLAFTEDYVYWAMDSTSDPKIFKLLKSNNTVTAIGDTPLGLATLGIAKAPNGNIIGWNRVEPNSDQKKECCIWQLDTAENITILQKFYVTEDNPVSNGLTLASAIDEDNKFFALVGGTTVGGLIGFVTPL